MADYEPDKIGTVLIDLSFTAVADTEAMMEEKLDLDFAGLAIRCDSINLNQAHILVLSKILERTSIIAKNGAAAMLFKVGAGE